MSEKVSCGSFQPLNAEQERVLKQRGTERPGSSPLNKEYRPGTYRCAGCGNELFVSDTKFDSGSGWPSFYDVANTKAVKLQEDASLGMHRVEVMCAKCGSHLGHVFNDAPEQPTGMRFCINSAALDFEAKDK